MFCISISHKRAPAQIREKYALGPEKREEFTKYLMDKGLWNGGVVLCTCNRTELYFSTDTSSDGAADITVLEQVQKEFALFLGTSYRQMLSYLNVYEGNMAVTHLFKVCGGLESKILGEDEILRQVKEAYEQSEEWHAADYEINMVFQRAIGCAKKIKTDTKISSVPVSITTIVANEAADFNIGGKNEAKASGDCDETAKKDFIKKNVLILGLSGKIGGTIAKNLMCKQGINIIGTIRNYNDAIDYASVYEQVQIIPFSSRYDWLDKADVVISATSSPHYTLCADEVCESIHEEKNRLFIDLAMPRDIDPDIADIDKITLYNIDYFETVSKENTSHKLAKVERAEFIMKEEIQDLLKELTFHKYYSHIGEWKDAFGRVSFEKMIFTLKKELDVDSMKTVFDTFDNLKKWI